MAPRFDDLFAFDTTLCHLRVYDGPGGETVALALQLEDSPGPSVANAAEALAERIVEVFGAPLRLFVIFSGPQEAWLEVLGGVEGGRAKFRGAYRMPRSSGLPARRWLCPLRSARPPAWAARAIHC